ncbi:MAG: hypothetical protein FWF59_04400 [Turicibacter sp.]|nr:hypothetical protein [Turicibacter sp.]
MKIALIFSLSIGLGVYSRHSSKIHGIKGTVLAVEDDYALISKRLDLKPHELQLGHDAWLRGNYELILTSPMKGLEVGQQVKVIVSEINNKEYPLQADVKDYRLLE